MRGWDEGTQAAKEKKGARKNRDFAAWDDREKAGGLPSAGCWPCSSSVRLLSANCLQITYHAPRTTYHVPLFSVIPDERATRPARAGILLGVDGDRLLYTRVNTVVDRSLGVSSHGKIPGLGASHRRG